MVGVDNDFRQQLFGPKASTKPVVADLAKAFPDNYTHYCEDIRNRQAIRDVVEFLKPHLIIHTAAQPSHDKAASIPFVDFEVNAVGTLNLLVAAKDFCPDAPFCFTSTNKVYGDNPNRMPMKETDTRYDYDGVGDVAEDMSVDDCLHSPFGASKLAADILCQEYGKYFGMPVGVFRGGCLTGPLHAAVPLHGYLAYIVKCACEGIKYTVRGYKGKQVRDQIHADDVASLFLSFYENPRCGEVYNLGGGRANSVSILETIARLKDVGISLEYEYVDEPRRGDHICYVTNLSKVRSHFPKWEPSWDLDTIFADLIVGRGKRAHAAR